MTGTARRPVVGVRVLREIGSALTTVVLVAAAFWPALGLLVDGTAWWAPALTCLAVSAVVPALSRLLLRRTWPGWLVAAGVDASVVLVLAVPSSRRWGPLPGPGTGDGIEAAADQIASSLVNDVAPVRPIPEITALVALSVAVAALLVEAGTRGQLPFTDRRRVPAAVVPLLLLPALAASFVVDHPVGAAVLVPALASAIGVLLVPVRGPAPARVRTTRQGWARTRSVATATSAAAVTAAVGLLVAPSVLVPDPDTGRFPVGSRWISPGASSGVDPFLDLSRDLRSPLSKDIITYAVNGDEDPYLRTSVISDLFSATWGPSSRIARSYPEGSALDDGDLSYNDDAGLPGRDAMAGTGYDPSLVAMMGGPVSAASSKTLVGIDAHDYASPWLLLPQNAYSAQDLPGAYGISAGTSTLRQVEGRSIKGGVYTVRLAADPEPDRLRRADSLDDLRQEYADVASSAFDDRSGQTWSAEEAEDLIRSTRRDSSDTARIPAPIRDAAENAVSRAGDPESQYEIAQALRTYLRGGEFVYSESAPIRTDGRTAGVSMVESFLEDKHGYCVHFASAMALLARAEGIPSRIAVGYTPGTSTGEGSVAGVSGTVREVNSQQAHAWAELYFVGVGWVPFDATPGFVGSTVDRAIESEAAPEAPAVEDPVAGRGTASAQPTEASDSATSSAPAPSSSSSAPGTRADTGVRGHWAWWVVAGAVLAAVPGLVWLTRRMPEYVRRFRERRVLHGGDHAARRAWVELARLAGVTGADVWARPAPASAASWFPRDEAAARLAAAVDRERYAAPASRDQDPQALLEDLRLVRQAQLHRAGGRSH
jgi:transglutaminase-like putative cysteine protease